MYLVGWFAVGFIVASIVMYVGRQWRRDRAEAVEQPSLLAAVLAAALLLYAARSSPNNAPATPAPETAPPRVVNNVVVFLKIFILLIVSFFLVWFAVASDRAGLWDTVIWIRSPFLGARFQCLLWGAAVGVATQIFRTEIAATSRQAFDATIGSKEGTAWVLQ